MNFPNSSVFGIVVEQTNIYRVFWRIPYIENVLQYLTQLFRIGFPVIFYMDLFSPGFYVFSCVFWAQARAQAGLGLAWPGLAGPGRTGPGRTGPGWAGPPGPKPGRARYLIVNS